MKQINLVILALICSFASSAQIAAISGPSVLCPGTPGTMSDATTGGTWSCTPTSVVTISSSTGVAVGITAGVATITYTVGPSNVTYPITVDALPGAITGPSSVCIGSTITLSDVSAGGTWSSSTPSIATVGALTGVVTGISPGVTTIMYTLPTGCTVSHTVTVDALPAPITGPSSVCIGGTGTLSASPGGGTWTISPATIATIGFATGSVTGVSVGSAVVSYVTAAGCIATTTVTIMSGTSTPHHVLGGGAYCAGASGVDVRMDGSTVGVTYQLYDGTIAVGSPIAGTGSALDFGFMTAAGTYTVLADTGASCPTPMLGTPTVAVNPLPTVYVVSGGGSYCSGSSGVAITLSGSDLGVSYQLYVGGVPVGTAVAGTGTSLSFGSITAAGTYTVVGTNTSTICSNNMSGSATITVLPLPAAYAITGGGSYCAGGSGVTIGLLASTTGVNYQLYLGGVPVGPPVVGIGSTISFGTFTAAGTYTGVAIDVATGCMAPMTGSAVVTVTPIVVPSVTISSSPGTTVCSGTSVSFSAVPTGGGATPTYAWTVDGSPVGSAAVYGYIPASGDVVGLTMTSSAACAAPTTATTSVTMTVDVPTVTATATADCGGSYTLNASGAVSYTWSPTTALSCTGCASPTVLPASTTTYTVTGTDTTGCTGTGSVSVDGNRISGFITYSGAVSTDTFKVWLIQFNPIDSTITATDSTTDCISGGMPYYQFMDKPSGSYLVKAKLNSAVAGSSGYMPTYSLSTPHWDSAASVSHTTAADTLHINMAYGTVPSGPGFISGYVVSGAGRSTTGTVPAVGMQVNLEDASGHILTYTYTATDGSYSFSHLGFSSYIIYPEAYKYYTTPSSVITLTSTSDSSSNIDFKQHTSFGTITPISSLSIATMSAYGSSGFHFFPNPAATELHFTWDPGMQGNVEVSVMDISGKEAMHTTMTVDAASGNILPLQGLADGIYVMTLRGDKFFTTTKLVKQQ